MVKCERISFMNNKKNKILFSTLISIIIILIIVIITFLCIGINKYIKGLYKEGIPITDKKIKNIILMIGDGMGENHVKAGAIYKGEELNIQKIKKRTYVTTFSTEKITILCIRKFIRRTRTIHIPSETLQIL